MSPLGEGPVAYSKRKLLLDELSRQIVEDFDNFTVFCERNDNSNAPVSFRSFHDQWERWDMGLVHSFGYSTLSTRDIIISIYRHLLGTSRPFDANDYVLGKWNTLSTTRQILVLYCLYCIYYSQPLISNSSIRMPIPIIPDILSALKVFHEKVLVQDEILKDAAFVFQRLWHDKAFQLVTDYQPAKERNVSAMLALEDTGSYRETAKKILDFIESKELHDYSIAFSKEYQRQSRLVLSTNSIVDGPDFTEELHTMASEYVSSNEQRKKARSTSPTNTSKLTFPPASKKRRTTVAVLPERPSTAPPTTHSALVRDRIDSIVDFASVRDTNDSPFEPFPLESLSLDDFNWGFFKNDPTDEDMPDFSSLIK